MIRDTLDLMNPHTGFTATATYYDKPMNGPAEGAQTFSYKYVNPLSKTYQRMFGNIQSEGGEVTIRTNDQYNWHADGVIITQDGNCYKIVQVMTDYQSAEEEAFRVLPVPVSTEYVLRMVVYQNPWGLR